MEENDLDITCGMTDDEMKKILIEEKRMENKIKHIKVVPIERYKKKKKKPYFEYPDGRKEYAVE